MAAVGECCSTVQYFTAVVTQAVRSKVEELKKMFNETQKAGQQASLACLLLCLCHVRDYEREREREGIAHNNQLNRSERTDRSD